MQGVATPLWTPVPLLLAAACTGAAHRDARPARAPEPPPHRPADPVLAAATAALAAGDVASARAGLERDRWLADERADAALLLAGCLLLEGDHARAIDVLREYLAKTPGVRGAGDRIATHLLRHHAGGGMERAASAREACYFGLYALGALGEPDTARPDLRRAAEEGPPPEQALARIALGRMDAR